MPRYSMAASTRVSGSSMPAEQRVAAPRAEHLLEGVGQVVDRDGLQDVGVRGLGGDVVLRRAETVEGELAPRARPRSSARACR